MVVITRVVMVAEATVAREEVEVVLIEAIIRIEVATDQEEVAVVWDN